MNQDEFETLLASLASQYAEACQDELVALDSEGSMERLRDNNEMAVLFTAYQAGRISGKNAEQRKAQAGFALEEGGQQDYVIKAALATLARKRATMVRVGIENEWKTWRAWLTSQGGNE